MAKPYDAAIDTLISKIDGPTTNGEKLLASATVIVEMEKYIAENPNAPDLMQEHKTLTYIYNTVSNVCRISSVEFAAKGLLEGM